MRQAEVYEKTVAPLVKGMNLVDIRLCPGNNGEVAGVLLKYHAPSGGPEPLSGGIYQGRIHFDGDAMA